MYILRLLLLLSISLLSPFTYASSPVQIFILHSYSQEYPWTKTQHNAFTGTLRANSIDTSLISTEYLDTKRKKYDDVYGSGFYSYLQDKYADYEPDIIYVTDDNALMFALDYLNKIFKNTPVIFSGVNNYAMLNQLDPSRVTGVFEKKEVSPNLKFLQQIDPELENILLVGDASNTYQAIEKEIKTELKQYPKITASFSAHNHINELTNALSQYRDKYVFLTTLGGVTDAEGQILTLEKTISIISQTGNHVILSMEDAYLYPGVLGGYVTSGKSQGRTAARLALDILNGKNTSQIPIITQSPNEYIFDYRELTKNSISLPESMAFTATILHEPLSFYERNRAFIMGSIISLVILLIISMAIFLIMLSRKNLKIQAAADTREQLVKRINEHAKQLESEQRKLNQAQAIAHIGNYTWEIDRNITTWSDELFHITGHSPKTFTPSYDSYVSCIHPEDRAKFKTLTEKVMKEQGHYSSEYRIQQSNGEIRYVLEEGEVLLDELGNMTSLVGVIHDITERKVAETEQERLQRELAQARKMEALGKLTGGIAHDFNNMLAIIIGYTDLAMDRFRDTLEPGMLAYLQNIEQASYRARDLVSKMMVFSRSGKSESTALHLDLAVKDIIEMLRSIIPSSIKIDLICEDNLPKIVMDPVQLQQIMMNLCINAKDAMNGKGTLNISLGWHRNINNECAACHKHIKGNWIDLTVSDTGSGMAPEVVERIFEPFFTTKEVGLGTGMGLSILHAIVDNHHGHILIETELSRGTSFHLLFPPDLHGSENNIAESEGAYVSKHHGQGESILIVDDEVALTDLLADLLNNHGYKCTVYNRSMEALAHFESQPESIDLVITDQTMPELTGMEMITLMRQLRPECPVILMTGYSEAVDKQRADKMGIDSFIDKPINNTQLLEFVYESIKKEKAII
ncbi:MAG TPA: ABC transporter substrate binding protein [Gammaproteobacteria bacterium]